MLDGRYYFHCLPLRYVCKINESHSGNQQWMWDIFDDRTKKVELQNMSVSSIVYYNATPWYKI